MMCFTFHGGVSKSYLSSTSSILCESSTKCVLAVAISGHTRQCIDFLRLILTKEHQQRVISVHFLLVRAFLLVTSEVWASIEGPPPKPYTEDWASCEGTMTAPTSIPVLNQGIAQA